MLLIELLNEYRSLKKEIDDLDQRIADVYQNSLFPKSSQITSMPRSPGYSNDGMNRIFEKIEELAEVYIEKKTKLLSQCLEIETEIDSFPSVERRLLRYRYIDGKEWSDISKLMGYSKAQLHRIKQNIFEKLQR